MENPTIQVEDRVYWVEMVANVEAGPDLDRETIMSGTVVEVLEGELRVLRDDEQGICRVRRSWLLQGQELEDYRKASQSQDYPPWMDEDDHIPTRED